MVLQVFTYICYLIVQWRHVNHHDSKSHFTYFSGPLCLSLMSSSFFSIVSGSQSHSAGHFVLLPAFAGREGKGKTSIIQSSMACRKVLWADFWHEVANMLSLGVSFLSTSQNTWSGCPLKCHQESTSFSFWWHSLYAKKSNENELLLCV